MEYVTVIFILYTNIYMHLLQFWYVQDCNMLSPGAGKFSQYMHYSASSLLWQAYFTMVKLKINGIYVLSMYNTSTTVLWYFMMGYILRL